VGGTSETSWPKRKKPIGPKLVTIGFAILIGGIILTIVIGGASPRIYVIVAGIAVIFIGLGFLSMQRELERNRRDLEERRVSQETPLDPVDLMEVDDEIGRGR